MSGFLHQDLSDAAEEEDGGDSDGTGKNGIQYDHLLILLLHVPGFGKGIDEIEFFRQGSQGFRTGFGRMASQKNAIGSEELTGDDGEIDETDDDVGNGAVGDMEGTLYLGHTGIDEGDEESSEDHGDRIELGKVADHDGGEAHVLCGFGIDGIVDALSKKQTDDSTQGTAEKHGSDDDPFDVDTDVFGGIPRFADDLKFIAVLAESKIDEDEDQ